MKLTQRALLFHKTQFEFDDKFLSYRIEDERAVFGFSVLYENIPNERSSKAFREKWLHYIGIGVVYISILSLVENIWKPTLPFWINGVIGALGVACILTSRWALVDGTMITTKIGNIIIFDRANKKEILAEIYRRRTLEIRRKYGAVDFLNDPRAEIAKFRSFKDQGIVSEQEFRDALSRLIGTRQNDASES